ncbi:glutathione S-transferase [Oleiphilus messinensis]|uniref:Glutathione S-transferase n=1 Tax=Oleiphilus messinensis TaxID=141451 RepID=A0A1Y0IEE2_9GAMM|nr:glutathione S-transferase [Oleiphilus messinensis]ARU58907.1 glutathione S-transferase [Oleiphilus messinensis]
MKLVASPTSPFARKIRIQLAEKNISFEWHQSIPWEADTDVGDYNPLGKVPALVADDGAIWFDSPVIVEFIETLSSSCRLVPEAPLAAAKVRQYEALCDGTCEAAIAVFLERKRESEQQNANWISRQEGKLASGLKAMSEQLGDQEWFYGESMTIADISAVCFLDWYSFRFNELDWQTRYPNLLKLCQRISARESFTTTKPE